MNTIIENTNNKVQATAKGLDFNTLLANLENATNEKLNRNETTYNLANLNEKIKLKFSNTNLEVDGEILPTKNLVGCVLQNIEGEDSNLAFFSNNDEKPFLLHDFNNDALILGQGEIHIITETLEQAMLIYAINENADSHFTLIAPILQNHFDSLVRAYSKKTMVTLLCNYVAAERYSKKFKNCNIRLIATVDIIDDLLLEYKVDEIINNPNSDHRLETKTIILNIEEWEPLEPLNGQYIYKNPYPIHAFGNELKAVIEKTSYYFQVTNSVAGQSLLGALSTICQPYVNAPFCYSHIPCGIFLITQLESGGGKTATNNYIYKEINEFNKQCYLTYRREKDEYYKILNDLKGQEKADFLTNEPLPKDKSFLISAATLAFILRKLVVDNAHNLSITSGEAGKLLGNHAMKAENVYDTISNFADLYSGQKIEYNTNGNHKDSGITQAFDKRLTIDLAGQPIILKGIFENEFLMQQGFLARFLISCEPSLVGKRVFNDIERTNLNEWQDPVMIEFWQKCRTLLDPAPNTITKNNDGTIKRFNMPLGDGAMHHLNNYRQLCENRLNDIFKNHQETGQRLAENASRIATLFAYYEGCSIVVKSHLDRAILLVEYSINELMRYNAQMQATQKSNSEKLLEWIIEKCQKSKKDFISYAETQSGVSVKNLRLKETFQPAIQVLVDKNYIKISYDKNKRFIKVNPQLLK